jgi:hypothetical protein
MEIHAPHHPVLTVKEALVHLAIITTGILIALSLEGALEWSHHRELVGETRVRLRDEIRGNQESVQIVLKPNRYSGPNVAACCPACHSPFSIRGLHDR